MIYIILFLLLLVIIYLVFFLGGHRYMCIEYYDMYKLDKHYKNKKRLNNCIISLTTTPNRISKMKPTLISLLDQNVSVKEIRLNIPYYSSKGVKYKIPSWIRKCKSIKVYRTVKDWGPATKLIPTLLDKRNKNKRIIVVDDDVVYGYRTIEILNRYFEKYNEKVAVTIYGDLMDHDENSIPTRAYNYIKGENYTDLLRGHSGYLVTPNMFTEKVFDYSKAPEEAFFVDDNWFSNHLRKNDVKILQIGMVYEGVPLPDWVACHLDGLHPLHNNDGKNEKIINNYFKD